MSKKMTTKRRQKPGPLGMPIYILAAAVAAIAGFVLVQQEFGVPPGTQDGSVASDQEARPQTAEPAEEPAGGKSGLKAFAKGPVETFLAHGSPRDMPEFTFTDADGNEKSLKDWQGRVVLLNIWATWCGPCREEMPSLSRLEAKLGGDQFAVVPVSVDRKGISAVQKFLGEIGVSNLPVLNDPSARLNFKVRALGLPATLLIDREGREIGRLVGPAEWDSPEAQALIRAALEQ